jgi:hypothetical protein
MFKLVERFNVTLKKFLILLVLVAGAYAVMNEQEANLVRSSWDQVKKHEVDILYAIFSDNPDIQAKFTQFAGKNLDSLKGTTEFATHATRIVSLISQYMNLLGNDANMPAIRTLFTEMGKNHKSRASAAQFTEFKNSFMNYMKAQTSMDAATTTGWNDAFDIMFGIVLAQL